MGAVLGACGVSSLVGEAACCLGPAAIGCCCGNRCGTCKNSTATRIAYAFLLLLCCISAWVMLLPEVGSKLGAMKKYTGDISCEDDNCDTVWSQLGVFRVMFGTSCFYFLFACLMIGVKSSSGGRGGIQNGFWGIKFLLIVGLCVGAFFIPNVFFMKYWGVVGMIGGFLFLLVQMVLLVDFAHSWAESWIEKMEDGSKCYKWLLLICSVGMYLLALIATILMFVFYTKGSGSACALNKTVISVNIILAIVMTLVAMSERVREVVPASGILQSGVMVVYTTYITWSAITGNPDVSCQPDFGGGSGNSTTTVVAGAFFTFVSVCYASVRTTSASQLGKLGMANKENHALLSDTDDDDDDVEGGKVSDNEKDGVMYNWSMFHATFALAGLYMMMVLTDWSEFKDGTAATIDIGHGKASVWVKLVSGWFCCALYIWTLVAPLCLPDRDFGN
eukprot:m.123350 g.123350  ORF g.123350 m.123350 type:complete len:447 (-) comp28981_c0_seq1:379-1719(-)